MNRKAYLVDIEGNGLEADKIWCISYVSLNDRPWEVKSITDQEEIERFFTQKDVALYGHNLYLWDIPTVERVYNIKVEAKIYDTLGWSWYFFGGRSGHSLELWGRDLGVKKVEIDDKEWEGPLEGETYEDFLAKMVHRCEEDVKINLELIKTCKDKAKRLYGPQGAPRSLYDYLSIKQEAYYVKLKNPFTLDLELCEEGLDEMEKKQKEAFRRLEEILPDVPVYHKKKMPKNLYKKDGSLSSYGKKWFDMLEAEGLPKDHQEDVKYIHSYSPPNANSSSQVKDYLFSLGWEPTVFKDSVSKKTGEVNSVPQLRVPDGDGGKKLPDCIQVLAETHPQLKVLEDLGVLGHRISILKGFLKEQKDGKITADIAGFTNTLRIRHKTLVNLPGVDREYGELIRGCLAAPEGYELVGCDVSGLEDTTKRHYIYKYDPKYVKEQMHPDFDAHVDIAVLANLMTKEEADWYKACDRYFEALGESKAPRESDVKLLRDSDIPEDKWGETKGKLKKVRHGAKQINFCLPVDNTTILTPKGWKSYEELEVGQEIVSYNKDKGELEVTPITSLPYFQDQECVSFGNHYWNVECTPNHRWWGKKDNWRRKGTGQWVSPKMEWQTYDTFSTTFNILNSAPYNNTSKGVGATNAKILGWVLADGHLEPSKKSLHTSALKGLRKGVVCSISQKKYCKELEKDLQESKVPYTKEERGDGVYIYHIETKWTRMWLTEMGLPWKSKHDIDYTDIIFKMSFKERAEFLHTFWLAAGGLHAGNKVYYQNKGKILDAVLLALTLNGKKYGMYSKGTYNKFEPMVVDVRNRNHTTTQRFKEKGRRKTNVFCVNNINETFIMKQGNTVTITGNSATYGVGADSTAKSLKISQEKAKKILDAYWKRNWAVKEFVKKDLSNTVIKVKENYGGKTVRELWVQSPINNFFYQVRSEKDLFSAINQSTGAYAVDMWIKVIVDQYPKLAFQAHDEIVLIVPKGYRERISNWLTDCMNEVNEMLKLNTPLRVKAEFGETYADVH